MVMDSYLHYKFVISISLLSLILSTFCCRNWDNFHHKFKKHQAKKIYKKLSKISNNNEMWMLSYLRKIDPFVFEELILYSFKKMGCKVYYNKRYTGDGGIDGKVKIDGRIWLIQDKRYTGYINNEHLQKFNELCVNRHQKGLFIHTGKTGAGVQNVQKLYPCIKIISGKNLITLIQGKYNIS